MKSNQIKRTNGVKKQKKLMKDLHLENTDEATHPSSIFLSKHDRKCKRQSVCNFLSRSCTLDLLVILIFNHLFNQWHVCEISHKNKLS